jgi:DNA-binding IclR family transcriptional regulator
MSKVDEVFNLFRKGGWYSAGEIADWVSLPESVVKKILNFLAEFGLVECDRKGEMARITLLGRKFHRLK